MMAQKNLQGGFAPERHAFRADNEAEDSEDLTDYQVEVLDADIGRLSQYFDADKLEDEQTFIADFEAKFNKTNRGRNYLQDRADGNAIVNYSKKFPDKFNQKVGGFQGGFRTEKTQIRYNNKTRRYEYKDIIRNIWIMTKKENFTGIQHGRIKKIEYKDQYGHKQIRFHNGKHFMVSKLGKRYAREVGFDKTAIKKDIKDIVR